MPERRIDQFAMPEVLTIKPCRHPDHEPAKMVVRPPGLYEHSCPGCGALTYFTVDGLIWATSRNVNVWVPCYRKEN